MKVLVVVDMQKDFIWGALGTEEARAIVPAVKEKIKKYRAEGGRIIFTRDTHGEDYLETQEGRMLPVPHCIRDTEGWQLAEGLGETEGDGGREEPVIDKPGFGSLELMEIVGALAEEESLEEIELVGLCTDICVISNGLLLKARLPETTITVDARCCAGVTPESHRRALGAMKMCQIHIAEE